MQDNISTHFVGCGRSQDFELIRIEIELINEHVGEGHLDFTEFEVRMISVGINKEESITARNFNSFYTGDVAWTEVKDYVRQYFLDRDHDMFYDLWSMLTEYRRENHAR